ncbi:MAG: hypothetical protein Kow00127_05750 [Bacteroidales bacterium]
MKKLWIFILILLLAAFIVAGYFFLVAGCDVTSSPANPKEIIGPETLLYAEFPDAAGSYPENRSKEVWEQLSALFQDSHPLFFNSFADSLFGTNSLLLEEGLKTALAVELYSGDELVPVWVFSSPETAIQSHYIKKVRSILGDTNVVSVLKRDEGEVAIVQIPQLRRIAYLGIKEGLCIATENRQVLNAAMDRIGQTTQPAASAFSKVALTSGQNAPCNLYINGAMLWQLLPAIVTGNNDFPPVLASAPFDWSEMDISLTDQSVAGNGYTSVSEVSDGFLSCFRQPASRFGFNDILPNHTAMILAYTTPDFAEHFPERLNCRSDSTYVLQGLSAMKRKFDINPYEELLSWCGSEAGLAWAGNVSGRDGWLAFVRVKDALRARLMLMQVAQKAGANFDRPPYEEKIRDYSIRQINLPALPRLIFGKLFGVVRQNFYLVIKDYVVFSNNPENLRNLVDKYYRGQTLAKSIHYRSFSRNMGDEANLHFYLNIPEWLESPGPWQNHPWFGAVESRRKSLTAFDGLGLQLSWINNMFYTHFYLRYQPDIRQLSGAVWHFETEALVSRPPVLITNHRTGRLNALVIDKNDNLYLADHMGVPRWSVPLIESPMGLPVQIDYYQNGKYQYLFNTPNYVYIIDLTGSYVADFPVRTALPATAPLACFDYENNGNYRFLIPLDDNRLYNFDKEMKPVEGWNIAEFRKPLVKPVQHLVADDKDFLIATEQDGRLTFLNRRGEVRISLKKPVIQAKNSLCYSNTENDKGLILTTGPVGELIYISMDGTVKTEKPASFSKDHYFLYDDWNEDGSNDFLYVDGRRFVVFSRNFKPLFETELPSSVAGMPGLFFSPDKGRVISITTSDGRTRFFNAEGACYNDLLVESDVPGAAGNLVSDKVLNYVSAKGNQVRGYFLEEN